MKRIKELEHNVRVELDKRKKNNIYEQCIQNQQLKIIDLSNFCSQDGVNLTDYFMLNVIIPFLKENPDITGVNLSGNAIQGGCLKELSQLVNIQFLDLSNNYIDNYDGHPHDILKSSNVITAVLTGNSIICPNYVTKDPISLRQLSFLAVLRDPDTCSKLEKFSQLKSDIMENSDTLDYPSEMIKTM